MAAWIGHGKLERRKRFFCSLNTHGQRLELVVQRRSASIGIQHESRVDVLCDPLRLCASGDHAGFLITRESQIEIPVGRPTFIFQPYESAYEIGDAVLIVHRSASEEITVFFGQSEGIAIPILRQSIHHVHVSQHHDGLVAGGTVASISHDKPLRRLAVAVVVSDHQVFLREASIGQTLREVRDHVIHLLMTARRTKAYYVAIDVMDHLLVIGQLTRFGILSRNWARRSQRARQKKCLYPHRLPLQLAITRRDARTEPSWRQASIAT